MATSKKITASFALDAQQARQELDSLRAAEESFTAAGGNLATSLSNGFKQLENDVDQAFKTLQSGGSVSESAISKIVSRLAAMKEAAEAAGAPLPPAFEAGFKTADAQVTALIGGVTTARERTATLRAEFQATTPVVQQTADAVKAVGDEAAAAGQTGQDAFENIRGAALTFESVAKGATDSVREAWRSYNEEQKLTPKQINEVGQAVEALKIVMAEQATVGQQATEEQIGVLAKLEGEYSALTTRAGQLTNATKDNAVNLKETGSQVSNVAQQVQALTSQLGPYGQEVGRVAGTVGGLAGTVQQLKGTIGALDLNTLSAGKSAAALGVQLGAVAAAAIAAVAAGTELAETNQENADSLADFVKWTKEVLPSLDDLKSKLGGVQTTAQNALQSLLSGDLKGYANDLTAVAIAAGRGRDATSLYYDLLRNGVSTLDATEIATAKNTATLRLYNQAREQGGRSTDLWNDAVRQSGGDAEALTGKLEILGKQLDDEKRLLDLTTEAQKANNTAKQAAISIAEQKADSTNRLLSAEDVALVALTESYKNLEQAQSGTTATINAYLQSITALLPESERNAVLIERQATLLAAALANTNGLTNAERARIAGLVELLQRAGELTAAEEGRAAQVAKAILSGEKAVAVTRDHVAALNEYLDAEGRALEAQRQAAQSSDDYTVAIRNRIIAIEDELAARGELLTASGAQQEIDMDLGGSADYLRMKRAQLIAEEQGGLSVWHASTKATDDHGEAQRNLAAIIERERDAAAGASKAVADLNITFGGAKLSAQEAADTIRKLGEELRTAEDAARRFKETMDRANESVRNATDDDGDDTP